MKITNYLSRFERAFFMLCRRITLSIFAGAKEEYDRFIPIGEIVENRWDRARRMGFGHGTSVYDSCLVIGDVSVGNDCWIGPFSVLDGSGGLQIGGGCTISAGVQVYTHDNIKKTISGGKASIEKKAVVIGNNVYLGPNCVVTKGACIGDNAVVGANSLVFGQVNEGETVAGNPARVISKSTEST